MFDSLQVKRYLTSSIKNIVFELPHKLLKDLVFKEVNSQHLSKYQKISKFRGNKAKCSVSLPKMKLW